MVTKDDLGDAIERSHASITSATVIERNIIPKLLKSTSMEEVTVLTGVRRSGKTYILYDLLKKQGGTYINFEDERLNGFKIADFQKLMDIIEERESKILYMDEVQHAPGWEKFAHRAHREVKMFVTGSNSSLLYSDFARALVGRTITYTIRPLDFNEFLRFRGKKLSRTSFLDYMRIGGFPRIALTGETKLAQDYLERIIYHDIVSKNNIRNPKALKDLAIYLLSNIGKEFSYRSLKEISGLKHETTIRQYLDYLESAFLLSFVKMHSGSLRKQETYPKKVYAVDPAFIALGKRLDDDRGLVLENMVFNHLAGSYDIFFTRNGGEVDFLLCKGTRQIEAVNVTFEVKEKKALDREVKGLLKIAQMYKIKARLISVYSVNDLPETIENDLAHRYLASPVNSEKK